MATLTDAERVLADDQDGLARLHAVLHGPAGNGTRQRVPSLEARFGVPPDPDQASRHRRRVGAKAGPLPVGTDLLGLMRANAALLGFERAPRLDAAVIRMHGSVSISCDIARKLTR